MNEAIVHAFYVVTRERVTVEDMRGAFQGLDLKTIQNTRDDQGNSFLHKAAMSNNLHLVQELVETYGCDVNALGAWGETVLHSAVLCSYDGKHLPLIQYLVEHGVRTDVASESGMTASELTGDEMIKEYLMALPHDVVEVGVVRGELDLV
jgi:hypothetical protein